MVILPGTGDHEEDCREDLERKGHSNRNHRQLPVWQVGGCLHLAEPGGEGLLGKVGPADSGVPGGCRAWTQGS